MLSKTDVLRNMCVYMKMTKFCVKWLILVSAGFFHPDLMNVLGNKPHNVQWTLIQAKCAENADLMCDYGSLSSSITMLLQP